MFITHVIIIIKLEVSTVPIVTIFFCGCVPVMFVASYSVTYCIYIPGFGLQMVFVSLCNTPSHHHHYANLFDKVELINYLSDIFCRVCV